MFDILTLDTVNFPLVNQITVITINVVGVSLMVLVVMRRSLRDRLTSVFLVMSLLMLTWINFAYLARLVGENNLESAELFLRIAWVATPPFFAYVYLITTHIVRQANTYKLLRRAIVISSIALGALTALSDYIIAGISFSGNDLDINYGIGFLPFLGIITVYIVATLLPVFTTKLETYRKHRVNMVLIGLTVFYVANLVFNIALPAFMGITHLYYFGDYSLVFLLGFIAYAIARHRLLDIRLAIFRAVSFLFLVALFAIIYVVLFALVVPIVSEILGIADGILAAVAALFSVAVARYGQQLLRKVTDRFLFQQQADYRAALVTAGQRLSQSIDIEDVSAIVVQTMRNVVRAESVTIFLKDEDEGNMFIPQLLEGIQPEHAKLPGENALVIHARHTGGAIIKDEITQLIEEESRDAHRKELEKVLEAFDWLDVQAALPLFVDQGLTGLILLGEKKSGDPYLQADAEFLSAFAPQAATALENARLYKESLEFSQKLEEEVERATHELEAANRQLKDLDKAKSEFLSIASHQLYTPLTAIRGYLSMLQEGDFGDMSTDQQPVIDILDKSATRLIDLIKNLLDISRIESGRLELNLEAVDLAEMAKELVQDLMPNAMNKDLNLEFHKPQQPVQMVIADRQRIRQVMLNFIDNSIKYTDSGSIDVTVGVAGDQLEFAVTDTGKGLAPDEITKLFTKFTRVGGASKYHTEGTGLGLYVAQQIVREHHGEVAVQSDGRGKGSTFSMTLPVQDSPRSLRLGDKATVVIKAAETVSAATG